MEAPLVTVVLPTFNRLELLRIAVDSVLAQTFTAWELIVVDDGSHDETRNFLRGLRDPRVSVTFAEHTGVPAVVRNRGIARARGRYVAFMDSDDKWAPQKLLTQLVLMRSSPKCRWSYTAVRRIDADGNEILTRSVNWAPHAGWIMAQVLCVDAQIATPSVMAELELVRELGGFDESMRFIEDYDLWARMALESEAAVESTPLVDVRSHTEHFTQDRAGKLDGWVNFYSKMETLVRTRPLRALCRQRKSESLLALAAEQAKRRDWVGMRSTLLAATRARAFRPLGWLRVARAAASPARSTVAKSD